MTKIPLFPLKTVLLPGGLRPLQITEPHYLDMVKRCMQTQQGFVHIMPSVAGMSEPGQLFPLGTYVEIVDFHPLENGLLGIMVEGRYKVRVTEVEQLPNRLLVGKVESLPLESSVPLPEEFKDLATLLDILSRHPLVQQLPVEYDFEDALEVGARLAELLPLAQDAKYSLLEYQDPLERLSYLQLLVKQRSHAHLA